MPTLETKDISTLLANNFSLEFFNGTLVQQAPVEPVTYSGPGSITQDLQGNLQLKLYHTFEAVSELNREFENAFGGHHLPIGKLIDDHHYFAFQATDMTGQVWSAKMLWVTGDVSYPASGRIVKAKIQSLEAILALPPELPKPAGIMYLIVPGAFSLPCTRTEWTAAGELYKTCKITLSEGCCELKRYNDYLEIRIGPPLGEDTQQFSKRVIEALGIALGAYLQPILEGSTSDRDRRQVIHSRRKSAEHYRLQSPVPVTWPDDAKNIEAFVQAFLKTEKQPLPPIVGYWYRVLGAWDGDLENRALVLTTAIEGVVKTHFSDLGIPDEEFLAQVAKAITELEKLQIGDRARARAMESLKRAQSQSVKGALHALSSNGVFEKALVSTWTRTRNKAAHADELRFTEHEIQRHIDELYGCLELFYSLFLHRIGYAGAIIHFSKAGWPEGPFPVVKNTNLL